MSAEETTGTITIRKVPADCIAKLKETAKSHNRSMESEVRSVLEDYAAGVLARHEIRTTNFYERLRTFMEEESIEGFSEEEFPTPARGDEPERDREVFGA
ncbi:FitA-like ribbon-helix-helix domain-containing protein [Bifidobacterium samirii]|uniref:DNA-binding protein n=1 Tax=Bifidobacterium samirii TaxID=2306974 RepID=A0A430FVY5_9BIFI|nr:DNA-binding protein [Bifidobacterium samirii]RSX58356.1 DNA-binding protein [Bifidobacterium samirii]